MKHYLPLRQFAHSIPRLATLIPLCLIVYFYWLVGLFVMGVLVTKPNVYDLRSNLPSERTS